VFEPLESRETVQVRIATGALASHVLRLRLDLMGSLEVGRRVTLRYSPTDQWEGTVQRVERRGADSFSVFGTIDGAHRGWFIFTIDAGGFMGSVQIPESRLMADLRNIQGDVYALHVFDSGTVGRFDCGVQPLSDDQTPFDTESRLPDLTPTASTIPQHDVIVAYTQGLANDFPIHYPNTPLETAIQFLVDYANQSYANSGVALRMRLAYRGLVPGFSEAGRDRGWLLDNLTGAADGFMDQVHGWRTTYHADVVCLMYSLDTQLSGGGGLAWLLDPPTFNSGNPSNWYGSAFCVVEGLWAPNDWTPPVSGMAVTEFTHEIGHTQGLGHNCQDGPGVPVSSYAYGWRFTGNSGTKYITIMSYLTGAFADATIIPHFSNPSVFFEGQATGNAATAGCAGTTGANNAGSLSLTADYMSRLHLRPLDPWVDFNYGGATVNGRFEAPWKTLPAAIGDLPFTDSQHTPMPPTLGLKGPASSGTQTITLNKRMILEAHGGTVRIGAP